jgi:hypothetical protein
MKPIISSVFVSVGFALLMSSCAQGPESYSRTAATGKPDTITCRLNATLPGSRLPEQVCLPSAEWARYPRYGMDTRAFSILAPTLISSRF